MIIFEYKVTSRGQTPKQTYLVRVTDDLRDNVTTWFFGKEYIHTLPQEEIEEIIKWINHYPEIFDFSAELEPNDKPGGYQYTFAFSNREKAVSFSGNNILDYGNKPRRNATTALRCARCIKEYVLDMNNIRTTIPSRLQHWPKNRHYEPKMLKI